MKDIQTIKKQLAEQYFGRETEEYDSARSSTPARKYIVQKKAEIMAKLLGESKGRNILDVACGTGRFFYLYENRQIFGCDISKDQLREAKKKSPDATLIVADAEKLPYPDNKFDIVITSQFIEHIPQYKNILKEMARVCKPGGSIIADFPNKHSLTYLPTKARIFTGKLRHLNLFTKEQIKNLADELNLEIKNIENTVVISPNLFPAFCLPGINRINEQLIKKFPNLGYLYFIRFVKK